LSAGLHPDPLGQLTALPRPSSSIKGRFAVEKGGRGRRKVNEGKGRKRERRKKGRAICPNKNPGYGPDPI